MDDWRAKATAVLGCLEEVLRSTPKITILFLQPTDLRRDGVTVRSGRRYYEDVGGEAFTVEGLGRFRLRQAYGLSSGRRVKLRSKRNPADGNRSIGFAQPAWLNGRPRWQMVRFPGTSGASERAMPLAVFRLLRPILCRPAPVSVDRSPIVGVVFVHPKGHLIHPRETRITRSAARGAGLHSALRFRNSLRISVAINTTKLTASGVMNS